MPRGRIFLGYDAVDNDYFSRQAPLRSAAHPQGRSAGFSQRVVRKVGRSVLTPPLCPLDKAASNAIQGFSASCRLKPALRNYFIASARFVAKKNLPCLIEAYSWYRKGLTGENTENGEDRGWDLVLLGDGEMRPALEAQVAALNLQDHITMPGFKQYAELPAYYGAAGAFIHASTTEQWGLVVNEAMASGLPVLVSNRCGCAPDLVKEGINGFTFDPCNIEQLARLMRCVAEMEPGRRVEMGARSRQLIAPWGTERFAHGLQQAVQTALHLPAPQATLLDRFLLRALACR
jgi:glycosyltransferase involved in cell wall biosynthesis